MSARPRTDVSRTAVAAAKGVPAPDAPPARIPPAGQQTAVRVEGRRRDRDDGGVLPARDQARLAGWGRSTSSTSRVAAPSSSTGLGPAVRSAGGRGLIARGMGRSYGDAALCAGGTVLELTGRPPLIDFDPATGVLVATAGATLAQVMAATLPHGWMLPVLPGTWQVSLGGAVAADVHGKNHVSSGSFARHVQWLLLLRSDLEVCLLSPRRRAEEFWATVGGMGLTGVITTVCVGLRRAGTGQARRSRRRARDLSVVTGLLDDAAQAQRMDPDLHAVAWIDATARGAATGRGIVETTRILGSDSEPSAGIDPDADPFESARHRPRSWPGPGVVGRATIAAGNRARWITGRDRRPRVVDLASALHPLDRAGAWPAMFGRGGLVQYQFAVPEGAEPVLLEALTGLVARRVPPALAVLKRLGPADPAPLSFPLPGWTLALDFPARWQELNAALDRVDRIVADAGGRVYLAKDSRLSPAALAAMYPRLPEWRATRDAMDPDRVFASDLARRLHLVTPRGGS